MVWKKMVSEHAKIVGVSESTAQWRPILACVVLFAIGACVVVSYVPSSLFQTRANTQVKNDTEPLHEPYQHEDLKNAVAAMIKDQDIGLSAMCDGIYNLTFLYEGTPDSMYGTIAAGSARLPAIKTRIKFMCVSTIDGARQENSVRGWEYFQHAYRPLADAWAVQVGTHRSPRGSHARNSNLYLEERQGCR